MGVDIAYNTHGLPQRFSSLVEENYHKPYGYLRTPEISRLIACSTSRSAPMVGRLASAPKKSCDSTPMSSGGLTPLVTVMKPTNEASSG